MFVFLVPALRLDVKRSKKARSLHLLAHSQFLDLNPGTFWAVWYHYKETRQKTGHGSLGTQTEKFFYF